MRVFCRAVRVSEGAFACMAHKRPVASPVDNQVIELDETPVIMLDLGLVRTTFP